MTLFKYKKDIKRSSALKFRICTIICQKAVIYVFCDECLMLNIVVKRIWEIVKINITLDKKLHNGHSIIDFKRLLYLIWFMHIVLANSFIQTLLNIPLQMFNRPFLFCEIENCVMFKFNSKVMSHYTKINQALIQCIEQLV